MGAAVDAGPGEGAEPDGDDVPGDGDGESPGDGSGAAADGDGTGANGDGASAGDEPVGTVRFRTGPMPSGCGAKAWEGARACGCKTRHSLWAATHYARLKGALETTVKKRELMQLAS